MNYLLMIYVPTDEHTPDERKQMTPEEQQADMQQWIDYTTNLMEAGVHRAGEPLQGLETATTVRIRNDETLMTDGPFAETKEYLAGYYLIDTPHLDDALKWAAQCPAAAYGSIEVRPLAPFPGSE